MKLALLADTHAGARNDHPFFNESFLRFFEEKFFPYLEQTGIKTVVHLGDVFDRRKYINFQTLNTWRVKIFDRFQEMGIEVHIILGNHDTYWKTINDVNSVEETLRLYPNIKIYNEATVVKFDGTEILFIPWVNPTNEESTKKIISTTTAQLVMGHLEIMGFEYFKGHPNLDKGFDKKIFEHFDIVMSGHYHYRSQQDNIIYLGSPYQWTWNDYGDDRGFHVFDTKERTLEFHPNGYQIFEKLTYNDEGETEESLSKLDFTEYKAKCLKVIVEKKNDPRLFEIFLEKLHEQNPADISVVDMELQSSFTEELLDESKDTLSILLEYTEGLNLDENVRKELVELLRTLYLDASTFVSTDNV